MEPAVVLVKLVEYWWKLVELGGILVKFGKLFDGIVGIWWSLQSIMSDFNGSWE